jgi:two-component system, OmpR family, response regulator CpxR
MAHERTRWNNKCPAERTVQSYMSAAQMEPRLLSAGPILIVDDDPDIRELLAEALEDLGFATVTAENGLEAANLVRSMEIPPSLILLDLMMPVMDGYEFLEERSNDPLLAAVPVAIITAGYGVDRDRLGSGTLIIPKPIDMPLLVDVIEDLRSGASPA